MSRSSQIWILRDTRKLYKICDPVHLVGQVYSEITNKIVCNIKKIKGHIDFVQVVFLKVSLGCLGFIGKFKLVSCNIQLKSIYIAHFFYCNFFGEATLRMTHSHH